MYSEVLWTIHIHIDDQNNLLVFFSMTYSSIVVSSIILIGCSFRPMKYCTVLITTSKSFFIQVEVDFHSVQLNNLDKRIEFDQWFAIELINLIIDQQSISKHMSYKVKKWKISIDRCAPLIVTLISDTIWLNPIIYILLENYLQSINDREIESQCLFNAILQIYILIKWIVINEFQFFLGQNARFSWLIRTLNWTLIGSFLYTSRWLLCIAYRIESHRIAQKRHESGLYYSDDFSASSCLNKNLLEFFAVFSTEVTIDPIVVARRFSSAVIIIMWMWMWIWSLEQDLFSHWSLHFSNQTMSSGQSSFCFLLCCGCGYRCVYEMTNVEFDRILFRSLLIEWTR